MDFRARVLGLNGYKLTRTQLRNIESRKSWMKAICFNLLYGFRCSEFKAIRNLDEPVTIDGYTFKALHDPTNDENILVIDEGFWVIDTSGKRHYITVKTGNRIARPMIHPDYPDLIELLGKKRTGISNLLIVIFLRQFNDMLRSSSYCCFKTISSPLNSKEILFRSWLGGISFKR